MCVDEAVGCQKRPAAFFVNISQQIHFVNGIMMYIYIDLWYILTIALLLISSLSYGTSGCGL